MGDGDDNDVVFGERRHRRPGFGRLYRLQIYPGRRKLRPLCSVRLEGNEALQFVGSVEPFGVALYQHLLAACVHHFKWQAGKTQQEGVRGPTDVWTRMHKTAEKKTQVGDFTYPQSR